MTGSATKASKGMGVWERFVRHEKEMADNANLKLRLQLHWEKLYAYSSIMTSIVFFRLYLRKLDE